MEIKYLGKNSLWLIGKKEKVLIDPSGEVLEQSKFGGRVVLYTSVAETAGFSGERVVVSGPGEYEIGGVEVWGTNGGEGRVVYLVTVDGVKIVVLGSLTEALSEKKIERIDEADVLVVSVENKKGVAAKTALEWAKKWGVNYVVPVGFETGDENIKNFLDEADEEGAEPVEGLKIDKDDLPEGMEVVLLCPSR